MNAALMNLKKGYQKSRSPRVDYGKRAVWYNEINSCRSRSHSR